MSAWEWTRVAAGSYVGNPGAAIIRGIVGRVALIGAGSGVPVLVWSAQPDQPLDSFAAVETLALDALTETTQETSADVGIEGRRFDAQYGARLLCGQELLTFHHDHADGPPKRKKTQRIVASAFCILAG